MDIEIRKEELRTRITIFTWFGGVSAAIALIPIFWAAWEVFQNHQFFKENELGDFIGGTSGTFASFAGLAFVYVGFLGQQLQILLQQEELQLNRQELQDTRIEIQGQKQQLELQNKQFQIQSFETVFFNLLSLYKEQNKTNFPNGQLPLPVMARFEQILKSHGKYTSKGDPTDSIIVERTQTFKENFNLIEIKIDALIRSFYGICLHIYNHRSIIDEKYYIKTLFRQLDANEKNVIFYGFFAKIGLYEPQPHDEQIVACYLRSIDSSQLIILGDFHLLEIYPTEIMNSEIEK